MIVGLYQTQLTGKKAEILSERLIGIWRESSGTPLPQLIKNLCEVGM